MPYPSFLFLLSSGFYKFTDALSLRSKVIIRQNIVVALGTVITMVCAAFLFPIPLTLGVAAHEGSTLLVVLNSLRLLAVKLPELDRKGV